LEVPKVISKKNFTNDNGVNLAGRKPCRTQTLQDANLAGRKPCRTQTLQGANLAGRKPCRAQTLRPYSEFAIASGGHFVPSSLGRLSLRASPGNLDLRKSPKNLTKLDWYTINPQVP